MINIALLLANQNLRFCVLVIMKITSVDRKLSADPI